MEIENGCIHHLSSKLPADSEGKSPNPDSIEVTFQKPPRTSSFSFPSAFVEPEGKSFSLGDIVELIVDGTERLKLGSESRHPPKPNRRGSHNLRTVTSSNSVGATVRFGNLHIREYERALGDTPCSAGPPISIGWRCRVFDENRGASHVTTEVIVPIENYEQLRGPRAPVRDLILSRFTREALLIEHGVPRVDLVEAVRQNIKVKNQRRQTITNLPLAPVEETIERWSRQWRKLRILTSSKRKQAKTRYLMDQWVDSSTWSGSVANPKTHRSYPQPIKGILVTNPEARRKEKRIPPGTHRRDSVTTSTNSEDVSH